jgi:hypothetical protein
MSGVRVPEREDVYEAYTRLCEARAKMQQAEADHQRLAEARYGARPVYLGEQSAAERISELERALWAALQGREVVIASDTPRDIEWKTLDDGERLARRKWKPNS